MRNIIECPSCRRRLLMQEDVRGEDVKCPACGTVFNTGLVPPEPAVLPHDRSSSSAGRNWEPPASRAVPLPDEDAGRRTPGDRGQSSRRKDRALALDPDLPARTSASRRDWRNVRTGIGMVLASVILLAVTGLLVAFAAFLLTLDNPRIWSEMEALAGLLIIVAVASEVLTLVGYGFCLSAPPDHGAKHLIIATLFLGISSLLLGVVNVVTLLEGGMFVARPNRGGDLACLAGIVNLVAGVLYVIRIFTFLFFLRSIAFLARAHSMLQGIQSLMVLVAVAIVGYLILVVVAAGSLASTGPGGRRDLGEAGSIVLGCGCIELALVLVAFVWYIGMLVGIRRTIDAKFR